jgi:amino acid adenylation domain-containing protein
LHGLLRGAATANPNGVAVVDGDRRFTYAQLDAWSDRIAEQLTGVGVARGDRVGVHLTKSAEAVAGIYGVLKAGGCYVPLDPQAPVTRLSGIATDAGIQVLVTDGRASGVALAEAAAVRSVVVPDPRRVREAGAVFRPAVEVAANDLAYVLYTSGSTGAPKGVMLTHGNGLAFIRWAVSEFALTEDDRLSSHAPLHFDLSVFDLYAAAAAAATVVLIPARELIFPVELATLIRRERLTVWYSVPSALMLLLRQGALAPGCFPDLRLVLFAGEVFPIPALRATTALVPAARFVNLYGPTETNVCTWHEVSEPLVDDDPVPIGRALPGVRTVVLTTAGEPARPGESGELLVGGPTVMRGYWGDPGRTAAALVQPPGGGAPMYRTGDLVCVTAAGNLLFLGRRDHQIKTRGYRVELAEIEAALHRHPAVAECAVIAIPDNLITNRIVACVVIQREAHGRDLARVCRDRLPRYMVPERFEILGELPRTSTNKIDRKALVAMVTT